MKLFLIGVGGTGMRCLEAFTHLAACGIFDGQEIDILSLDTDTNNGNKSQSEQLIDTYMRIKKDNSGKQVTLKDSFFSANVNLFRFSPEYAGANRTFRLVSKLGQSTDRKVNKDNEDLMSLLFDREVQEFDLAHGYRAQTHIGSYLMYHAILEEVTKIKNGEKNAKPDDITAFLKRLSDAGLSGQPVKVFIMGSVFGGTGASSIPVIPRALKDALHVWDSTANIAEEILFGATLLTNYFTFNKPTNQQLVQEKVIADADKFSLNSQAALMFYEADHTIRNIYQRMYHVGWSSKLLNYDEGKAGKNTTTGGAEQKNIAHIVELMCATAAYNFFKDSNIKKGEHKILYKTIAVDGERFDFNFADFVGQEEQYKLMDKWAAFYALSFMVQNHQDGDIKNFVHALATKYNIADYKDLTEEEAKFINNFLKMFAFSYSNGNIQDGWLRQLQKSSTDEHFLFSVNSYQTDTNGLKKYNWGQLLDVKEHQFEADGGWLSSPKPYDTFLKKFREDINLKPATDFESAKIGERLLFHIYQTFKSLHKIRK
ncbi:MAG: hypothetical protein MUE81_00390 [Thermoflexibacter sp.]|nr:hypothetical protein [Thermoflexibacter sp.]